MVLLRILFRYKTVAGCLRLVQANLNKEARKFAAQTETRYFLTTVLFVVMIHVDPTTDSSHFIKSICGIKETTLTMSIYQKFIESSILSPNQPASANQTETLPKNLNYFQQQQQQQQLSPRFISTPVNINEQKFDYGLTDKQRIASSSTSLSSRSTYFELERLLEELVASWLMQIRFEPEQELMSCMEARTLTTDKNCASLMAIKSSYIFVREIRQQSIEIFNLVDSLIKNANGDALDQFYNKFIILEEELLNQINIISARNPNQVTTTVLSVRKERNPLTINFSTPKKSKAVVCTLKPIDKLAQQIKCLCDDYRNNLEKYLNGKDVVFVDKGYLFCELKTLNEIYEKFLDIVIRAECLIIIEALHYNLTIKASDSSYKNLPLKWSLVALWILTNDDSYLINLLTEKWQTTKTSGSTPLINTLPKKVARKLDFLSSPVVENNSSQEMETKFDLVGLLVPQDKQVTPISLMFDIIITQPNKHRRVDVVNFIRYHEPQTRLIELDDSFDEEFSKTSAIYSGNQYKVAAIRILNHFCNNDTALKTILKLLSSYTCDEGNQENTFINCIFKPYLNEIHHIYQNEATLNGRQFADSHDDPVVVEALGLFVQLTNFFHQSSQPLKYLKLLNYATIECLLKQVENVVQVTSSRDILLLSLSVLGNISFLTSQQMDIHGTTRTILNHLILRPRDLELRDKTITLFANFSQSQPDSLIENGGLSFILSCLESCIVKMLNMNRDQVSCDEAVDDDWMIISSQLENKPQTRKPIDVKPQIESYCDQNIKCRAGLNEIDIKTLERIQQNAAVATARLASDMKSLRFLVENGAIELLVGLCKSRRKRNKSDLVLIACVNALKKFASYVDKELFRVNNAIDLIELEVNQIVKIYGN